jgi:guanine nucleotide-binding protein subunit alpha
MRLLHTKGFSSSERKQWKVTIFNNLLHAFQVIFGAMEEQEVDFAHESNIVSLPLCRTARNICTDNPKAFRRNYCC